MVAGHDAPVEPRVEGLRAGQGVVGRLAAENRFKSFFHKLLTDAIDHRNTGAEPFDDLAVAPAFAVPQNIGLQQNPRFLPPLRRAFAFSDEFLQTSPFVLAQPDDVFLYCYRLECHDRIPHRCHGNRESHNPFKLIDRGH